MSRLSLLPIAAVTALLVPASTVCAAQRTYKVRSATAVLTVDNTWLNALKANGVELSAGQGATLTVRQPKDAAPIVKVTFKLRTTKSNIVSYKTSQGTLLGVYFNGAITLRSTDQPGSVTFRRMQLSVSEPALNTSYNRLDGEIVRSQPRGVESFLKLGRVHVPAPSDGKVEIRVRDARFDGGTGLLNGTDPESPAGSANWFPAAARGVMGDLAVTLTVKRM